jgi:hypothetical protein
MVGQSFDGPAKRGEAAASRSMYSYPFVYCNSQNAQIYCDPKVEQCGCTDLRAREVEHVDSVPKPALQLEATPTQDVGPPPTGFQLPSPWPFAFGVPPVIPDGGLPPVVAPTGSTSGTIATMDSQKRSSENAEIPAISTELACGGTQNYNSPASTTATVGLPGWPKFGGHGPVVSGTQLASPRSTPKRS